VDDPQREATSPRSECGENDDAVLELASACTASGLLALICVGVAATIGIALKIGGVI
jgi:hypothetical protein